MKTIKIVLCSAAALVFAGNFAAAEPGLSLAVSAEAASVHFNEATGELMLRGDLTLLDLDDYRWDESVKSVVAEKGTVLPEDASELFRFIKAEKIDLSAADASHVTNMSAFFRDCDNLQSVNIQGLDTAAVTDMSFFAAGCGKLAALDLHGLNTSAVTNMKYMLYHCKGLESVDLAGIDTSAVTDISGMFLGCEALETLDLSSFEIGAVQTMRGLFGGCKSLKTIWASDKWQVPEKLSDGDMVFYNTGKLVGGNGTVFSDQYPTDATFARIDKEGTPGYFTYKAAGTGETAYLKGDFDGNGIIDAGDAQNVLNVYAEIVAGNAVQMTAAQKLASDVSGDGAVDSADAQLILLYYVQNSVAGSPTEWEDLIGK